MDEICKNCLYSDSTSLIHLGDLMGETIYKCTHENSPYYDSIVNENNSCRLFVDYEEYIKLKDRKESIITIKNKRHGK